LLAFVYEGQNWFACPRWILQHLAKEVQKAFVMFEAPQVDVKLFHYKVL